jgi:hypothetical protein
MMKLSIILLAVLLIPTIFLISCDDSSEIIPDVDPADITAAILEAGEFPEMVSRDSDRLAERYFGIDTEGIVQASHWFSPAGAAPDIITVVKTDSEETAQSLKAFFEEWIQTEIDGTLGDYHPGQQQKLEELIVCARGNYAVVFICNDSAQAFEIFTDFIKGDNS